MSARKVTHGKSQSSMELLITLGFGLIVLIPVIILAFMQVSNSAPYLSVNAAQSAASKLASVADAVASQGASAKQTVLIQVPPNVYNIYVGTLNNKPGHEIIFVIRTNTGFSYVTAYTPFNVSGSLEQLSQPGTYLVSVSTMSSCLTAPGQPCVYLSAQPLVSTTISTTCYELTLTTGSGGALSAPLPANSIGCSNGYFLSGSAITLTASADSGYMFSSWTGTSSSGSNPWTFTMPSNSANEHASFTLACYQLSLTVGAGGASATASPANSVGCSAGNFLSGATTVLTATANSGYTFNSWIGTSSNSLNPWTLTMPANAANEQANFTAIPPLIWYQSANSLVQGSDDLGCVNYNNYLYCMGGTTNFGSYSGSLNTVQYASFLNGIGSSWQTTNSLSSAVYGTRCVTSGSYVYCMGGSASGYGDYGQINSVQYAQFQSDGSVSSWSASANSVDYGMGLDDASCVTSGSNIYCMGGYGYSGVILSQVESASALGATGTTAWGGANSLAVPVYDHSCITANNYIYCMGGYTNGLPPYYSPIATGYVQYASILNGGITSTWSQSANQLTANAVGLNCITSSGYIYCMGGANSGTTVQYASILSGGVTSVWQLANQLVVGEDLLGCTIPGNFIYCMGGDQNSHSTVVQYAQLPTLACYQLILGYGSGGASADASPSNSIGCSSGSYNPGQSLTLTTTANSGYAFNGWTGTSSNSMNPWSFTMPAVDANEQANFAVQGPLVWYQSANSLVQGSDDLSCVTYNNYLYCMGGTTNFGSYSGSLNTVQYASVLGSSSAWQTTNSLSSAVYGTRCVASGSYVYCMGGSASGYGDYGQINSVQYAQLQSDGSVSSWSASANSVDYGMGLDDASCVTSGSNIYCMGGYGYSGVILSQVESASALGATGTTAWGGANSLAVPVYDHSCTVSNGYIYCMGGYMNGPPPYYSPIASGYVQYASILNGGITSTWSQSANQLNANAVGLGCITTSNTIYCMGGANSGLTVQYASILGGGLTSAWQTSNQLAVGEDLHSCVTPGGYIYCMGGDQNGHSTVVQYTQLPIVCYSLTLAYGSGGAAATASPANSVGCSTGNFISGAAITITATANSGYAFAGWTGTSSSSSNPWAFTMPASAATETASFSTLPGCGTMPSSILSLIINCYPANIVNGASSATPANFQQKFSGTPFNAIAGNVIMYNGISGALVPCWAESNSIMWCNLGANTIAASSSANGVYYFGIGSSGTNFFIAGNDVGEAPQFSNPSYGKYDNGANVFYEYWNFIGPSAPSPFTVYSTVVTINNGVSFTSTSSSTPLLYTGFSSSYNALAYVFDSYSSSNTLSVVDGGAGGTLGCPVERLQQQQLRRDLYRNHRL